MTIAKRAWAWLPLMAGMAVVLLLSACVPDDVTVPDGSADGQKPQRFAIGFSNEFVENNMASRTRATAGTALSEHSTTMGVWGWRTDDVITDEDLFIDHLVSYTPDTDWAYTPLRYWEQHSTYRFNAYAPHSSDARAAATTVSVDEASGFISIAPITVTGDNIRTAANASHDLLNTFIASPDIDWMIAREGQRAKGDTRMKVQFVMQHILSKFNVRIRVDSVIAADEGVSAVSVDKLVISPFLSTADFTQKLNHTPDPTSAADMAAGEWTLDDTAAAIALNGATDVTPIDDRYTYVLESLLVPQALTDDMEVLLVYSFTYADGRTEHFTYGMKLADAFGEGTLSGAEGQFVGGSSYTLSFTIEPDIISFDGGVSDWSEYVPDAPYAIK